MLLLCIPCKLRRGAKMTGSRQGGRQVHVHGSGFAISGSYP